MKFNFCSFQWRHLLICDRYMRGHTCPANGHLSEPAPVVSDKFKDINKMLTKDELRERKESYSRLELVSI